MPTSPDLSFRSNITPFSALNSLLFAQSKLGSGLLPVLHGESSNSHLFRIYNNFARNSGIATALNVSITTYDGAGTASHSASKAPVSQSWLHVMENGFGENSVPSPDLFTKYFDIDTAVGGNTNKYYPKKGSDGIFGEPRIRAGSNGSGVGYVEVKTYTSVPEDAVGMTWTFAISVQFEWTT